MDRSSAKREHSVPAMSTRDSIADQREDGSGCQAAIQWFAVASA